jgi:hypothetical protein
MIKLWKFKDAPLKYRRLSKNGGDEDWLAFIPSGILSIDGYISVFETSAFDSMFRPQKIRVKGGEVWIGSHA